MERGGRLNRAAVVIADPNIEVVPIDQLICEWGTCVWTKGDYGVLYACSIYCKHDQSLAQYTRYVEEVVRLAGDVPLVIGMDSNAKSPMWH